MMMDTERGHAMAVQGRKHYWAALLLHPGVERGIGPKQMPMNGVVLVTRRRRVLILYASYSISIRFQPFSVSAQTVSVIRRSGWERRGCAATGPSSGADQLAEAFDPSLPFAVAGAVPNRTSK
jgi:hypothetical protein